MPRRIRCLVAPVLVGGMVAGAAAPEALGATAPAGRPKQWRPTAWAAEDRPWPHVMGRGVVAADTGARARRPGLPGAVPAGADCESDRGGHGTVPAAARPGTRAISARRTVPAAARGGSGGRPGYGVTGEAVVLPVTARVQEIRHATGLNAEVTGLSQETSAPPPSSGGDADGRGLWRPRLILTPSSAGGPALTEHGPWAADAQSTPPPGPALSASKPGDGPLLVAGTGGGVLAVIGGLCLAVRRRQRRAAAATKPGQGRSARSSPAPASSPGPPCRPHIPPTIPAIPAAQPRHRPPWNSTDRL